jgi:RNA polymerase sigma factor for flagellar operon FliA
MTNTIAPANLPSPSNLSTRDELIASSLPLVRSIALRLRQAYRFPSPLEDLIAAGVTGLIEAAERFDPTRSVAFTTFAFLRIRGAIFDLHRHDPGNAIHFQLPRKVAARPNVLQERQAPEQVLRLAPPTDASAELDPASAPTPPAPSFREIGPIAFVPFHKLDAMTDESAPDPDEEIDRKRRAEQIRVALAALPARERRILEMHYYAEKTFTEIGAAIGISGPRACRIHQRGLRMLGRALGLAEAANDNADGSFADAEEQEDEDVAPVTSRRRSANGGE